VEAVGSGAKTVRGCVAANTRENSIEVHYVSITFLLAFEWNRKSLKLLRVRVKSPPFSRKFIRTQEARTTRKDGAPGSGVQYS